MGTIHGSSITSGRSRQPVGSQAVRPTEHRSRRQVLSIGDDRVRMRRHSRVLLQPYDEGGETVQEGDRSTYSRMGCAEGRFSTTQQETRGTCQRSIVHLPVGPPESRRGAQLYGVSSLPIRRSVSFSDCITIYQFIDWPPGVYTAARKGMWTLYQRRFKIRIQMTEAAIGHVFSVEHRDKMFSLINKMSMI